MWHFEKFTGQTPDTVLYTQKSFINNNRNLFTWAQPKGKDFRMFIELQYHEKVATGKHLIYLLRVGKSKKPVPGFVRDMENLESHGFLIL